MSFARVSGYKLIELFSEISFIVDMLNCISEIGQWKTTCRRINKSFWQIST